MYSARHLRQVHPDARGDEDLADALDLATLRISSTSGP